MFVLHRFLHRCVRRLYHRVEMAILFRLVSQSVPSLESIPLAVICCHSSPRPDEQS